ncbi:hypothetical protein [Nostoc parmelioides]|uniref:Uncharacterized protein n=1 Tax=Nostoc parmelioides FACHB-3921 TaxID=2692909 RepID=A0ABR8BJD2_9NOSO|nr:hypothetical protein [Nostoc parmelioides]MBD2253998.1 hypothetical protein [Nostoc parmelioides FACHB-3921]
MDSSTLKTSVSDSQTLADLQVLIQEELLALLKSSRLTEIFKNCQISGEDAVKIQFILDSNKITAKTANLMDTANFVTQNNGDCCICWSEEKQDFVRCPCG